MEKAKGAQDPISLLKVPQLSHAWWFYSTVYCSYVTIFNNVQSLCAVSDSKTDTVWTTKALFPNLAVRTPQGVTR